MMTKATNDVARAMNRREALECLAVLGAGLLASGCASSADAVPAGSAGTMAGGDAAGAVGLPSCVLTPAATEGPFFVDERLNRSDLLEGETDPATRSGYPITLTLTILGINGGACQPLQDAHVDIWHANTIGLYSDEPANFVQPTSTLGEKYLRAYQVTDTNGTVQFRTIFPGWYASRTIHIHVKVRTYSPAGDKTYEVNTQLYFSDATNDQVLALQAYAGRGPRSIPLNSNDQVYNDTGVGRAIDTVGLPLAKKPPGDRAVLSLSAIDKVAGSTASFTVGVMLG